MAVYLLLREVPASKYLLCLPFDEGEGDIASDASGHGHDAILHNIEWREMESRAGIYFKGADSYAEIADAPDLNPEGDFSVEAYVCSMFPPNPVWWLTQGSIATKGKPGWPRLGWEVRGRPDSAIFIPFYSYYEHSAGLPGGEGFQYLNTVGFPPGKWSHIRFEVLPSLGETRGYVDGGLQAVAKYPKGLTNLASPGFPLYMGVAAGGGSGYCGFVNELKMRLI